MEVCRIERARRLLESTWREPPGIAPRTLSIINAQRRFARLDIEEPIALKLAAVVVIGLETLQWGRY